MKFLSGKSSIIQSLSPKNVITHHVLDEFDHLTHAKLPTFAKSPPELGRSHLALFLVISYPLHPWEDGALVHGE